MKLIALVIIMLFTFICLRAQDDVFKVEEPEKGFFDAFTLFSIVENVSVSPLSWGGGFGFSYTKNPFLNKSVFIGGELSYVFTGNDRITYSNDAYLANSSSLFALNGLVQYRPFRNASYSVCPEMCFGILAPGYSSTYYYYDYELDEQVGNLELARMFFTPNIGVGLGFRFFNYLNLKFRYQMSLPVKHFHPSDVYENAEGTEIFYPYVREPINRFEIIGSISLNRIK